MCAVLKAVAPRQSPLNAQWVMAAMKSRGLPVAEMRVVVDGLASMDRDATEEFRARIVRISRGSEEGGDLDLLAGWTSELLSKGNSPVLAVQALPIQTLPPLEEALAEMRDGYAANEEAGADRPPMRSYEKSHHIFGS